MNLRATTSLLCLSLLTATALHAQHYAAPGGGAYGGDGTCGNSAVPCNLAGAVEDATDGGASGNTVFIKLPAAGASVSFNEDLIGAARINEDTLFDTYTLPGPTTGVAGTAALNGDIIISQNDELELAANLEFQMVGNNQLQLRNAAAVDGDGLFVFTTGTAQIQLGDPSAGCPGASPQVATLENMRVTASSTVNVSDQCSTDAESDLFITNSLEVMGTLNMNDNNLSVVGPTATGGVTINNSAAIDGTGTFFISVDPAALGGPPNTRAGAYSITGGGQLNLPFDKNTDAGVSLELGGTGDGSVSFNRAGALYVTQAMTHQGTFRNEGGARTEFDALTMITGNLEITGPGGEVFPGDGVCGTGADESGVYLFAPVTVQGGLTMTDTDDPATVGVCIEGLSLEAGTLVASGETTVQGTFTADDVTGVTLGNAGGFTHNLVLQGNLSADEAPIFILPAPAMGKKANVTGNAVIFSGSAAQTLLYNTLLDIQSVQVTKTATGQTVTVAPASAAFLVDELLYVERGTLNTNGLLDANSGVAAADGATVVLNRDGTGLGQLAKGAGGRAYLSDAVEHIPGKIKYKGSTNIIAGDEIPGTLGSPVAIGQMEVAFTSSANMVTLQRGIAISDQLLLTGGDLDLNGFVADLGTTGTLMESAGNTVKGSTGTIKATRTLNAPASENVGGLGAVLTSGANMGVTEVVRGHTPQTNGSNTGIARYFDITPTTNSGLNATLEFLYDESELGGIAEAELELYRSTDGGTTWTIEGGAVDAPANKVTLGGVDAFSRWTAGSQNNPLPVELAAWSVVADGRSATLSWRTASETNNAGFEVEHQQGQGEYAAWQAVGFVEGQGTTTAPQQYQHRLVGLDPGTHRFRLKQLDFDGAFAYSPEVEVAIEMAERFVLAPAYPNPFNPQATVRFAVKEAVEVQAALYDVLGREVQVLYAGTPAAGEMVEVRIDGTRLVSGLYLVRLMGAGIDATQTLTLVK